MFYFDKDKAAGLDRLFISEGLGQECFAVYEKTPEGKANTTLLKPGEAENTRDSSEVE